MEVLIVGSSQHIALLEQLNQNLSLQENQIILKRFLDFNETHSNVISKNSETNFSIHTISLSAIHLKYTHITNFHNKYTNITNFQKLNIYL